MVQSATTRSGSFIERRVLSKLPRRIKRMIYVSSIFGLIHDAKDPDMELVRKLNELIHLSRSEKTCELPIHIRKTIWKNLDVRNVSISNDKAIPLNTVIQSDLSIENCDAIGKTLAAAAPQWLNYGSIATMATDVIVLIKQLKKLHGQTRVAAPA